MTHHIITRTATRPIATILACGLAFVLCIQSSARADENPCASERAALAATEQRLGDACRATANAQWALDRAQAQYDQIILARDNGGWNDAGAAAAAQDQQRHADELVSLASDAGQRLTATQQAAAESLVHYEQAKAHASASAAQADRVYQSVLEQFGAGPQVQGANKEVAAAQANVDNEIAEVRDLLAFDEDYLAAQAMAQSADATLRDLRRRPNHDLVALGAANRVLDQANRDMKQIEQARIDNDQYVQQARETLADARTLRDRLLIEAQRLTGADETVAAARQAAEQEQAALAAAEGDAKRVHAAVAAADADYRKAMVAADHAQAIAVASRQDADRQNNWIGGAGNDLWVAQNNLSVAQQAQSQAQSERDAAAAAVAACRREHGQAPEPPATQPSNSNGNSTVGGGGQPAARYPGTRAPVPWPPRRTPASGPSKPHGPTPRTASMPQGDSASTSTDSSAAATSASPSSPQDGAAPGAGQQPQPQQRTEPGRNTFRPPLVPRDGSARAPAGPPQSVHTPRDDGSPPPRAAGGGDRPPAPTAPPAPRVPQEKPEQPAPQQPKQPPPQPSQQPQQPQQQKPAQPQQQEPAQQQQQSQQSPTPDPRRSR